VSFGFHPYFGLPELSRAQWRLQLPSMQRLILDRQGIPTGEAVSFGGYDDELDNIDFDDGYALPEDRASFSLIGAGRRISVDMLDGYRYAQVFAPKDKDYIALEPMTAPANALISGRDLGVVEGGGRFRATFRISVRAV
jgi:aldose 1-epimerase